MKAAHSKPICQLGRSTAPTLSLPLLCIRFWAYSIDGVNGEKSGQHLHSDCSQNRSGCVGAHHIKEHTRCIWTGLSRDSREMRSVAQRWYSLEMAVVLDSGRLSGTAPCVLTGADRLWLFWAPKNRGFDGGENKCVTVH
jgi:hypothetical protein